MVLSAPASGSPAGESIPDGRQDWNRSEAVLYGLAITWGGEIESARSEAEWPSGPFLGRLNRLGPSVELEVVWPGDGA